MSKNPFRGPTDGAKYNPIGKPDAELKAYGFPPCPTNKKGHAVWNAIMKTCDTYLEAGDGKVTSGNLQSLVWSGAIVPPPCPIPVPVCVQPASVPSPYRVKSEPLSKLDYKFFYIASTWIIPHACPPPLQESLSKSPPYDECACYDFVGFDGWYESGPPVLAGGTKSICTESTGLANVFIQYEGWEEDFLKPPVQPGDTVSAISWICDEYFVLFLVNENTGEYARICREIPKDFEGRTAEWILGRQRLDYGDPGYPVEALPNFGSTYYRNNYAEYQSPTKYIPRPLTVDDADLIDMVDQEGQMIATAEKVGPNLLFILAYNPETAKPSK